MDADLLLHVVDASNPGFPEQMAQVQKVLHEIGAADIPQILVFNKLDSLPAEQRPSLLQDRYDVEGEMLLRLFVSAQSGEGLDALRGALAAKVIEAARQGMSPDVAVELPGTLP